MEGFGSGHYPVANHRVADRPDRFEPRLKKQRRNHYGWLTRPRADLKRDRAKGLVEIYVPFVDVTEAPCDLEPGGSEQSTANARCPIIVGKWEEVGTRA
jgi:hypothetical protein